MQPEQSRTERPAHRISEILSHYVHTFRYVLWTVLILAVVVVLGYFAWSQISQKREATSTMAAEAAQDLYDQWSAEPNADKKAALDKDLKAKLDQLVTSYPRQYGGQRGLFLRAEYYLDKKDWADAAKDDQQLATTFPKSYLAPIALFDAGVALESAGDAKTAEDLYVRAATNYKETAVAPRALFDAARLDEQSSAFDNAQKKYDQLGSDYPDSGWTVLAKNRIVALKVSGKIK